MQCSCIGFATDVERSEISGGVKFSAWAEARALPINEQNYFSFHRAALMAARLRVSKLFWRRKLPRQMRKHSYQHRLLNYTVLRPVTRLIIRMISARTRNKCMNPPSV